MRNYLYLAILLVFVACSEPFSFNTPNTQIDVVDAKVSTRVGESYIDIYRIDNGNRSTIKDLEVNVLSSSGEAYEFSYEEKFDSYQPIDPNFKGEVGVSYKMEASNSDRIIYESAYDSIPESIDFEILLEETTLMVFSEEANVLVEKRATAVSVQILLPREDFYSRSTFRYKMDDFFSPGDSVGFNDPIQYTLYKSSDIENSLDNTSIRLGERLIDTYFIFVDTIPACDFLAKGFFTSDFYPNACNVVLSDQTFIDCCHLENFWWLTYEVTMESLSKNAYEYWQNVEILSNNDGLIFDTYPFPLVGNISCNDCENQVVGSFRAVSESVRKENWSE